MFRLITANFDCRCSLTGTLLRKGDQIYFNDITKTVIEAYEYERLMQKTVIGDKKTYFTRHSKLNTKTK
jgi:hypothetical protein